MAFLFYFQRVNSLTYISLNGQLVPADQPILHYNNRGYRYGDGLFETMKMVNQQLPLLPLHFDRLSAGLKLLGFDMPSSFTMEKINEEIILVSQKNNAGKYARVRLSVYRGNGGLYDIKDPPGYIIECVTQTELINRLNDTGLNIDIYPDARKVYDKFSHLKSSNYLPYVMGAIYARKNNYQDCLILNQHDRIADATIANVFLVKHTSVITPPLSEGAVGGVMRRYLLEKLSLAGSGYQVIENPIGVNDILIADELFLTNAVSGIKWVKQFRDKSYGNTQTVDIYNRFVKTIWE